MSIVSSPRANGYGPSAAAAGGGPEGGKFPPRALPWLPNCGCGAEAGRGGAWLMAEAAAETGGVPLLCLLVCSFASLRSKWSRNAGRYLPVLPSGWSWAEGKMAEIWKRTNYLIANGWCLRLPDWTAKLVLTHFIQKKRIGCWMNLTLSRHCKINQRSLLQTMIHRIKLNGYKQHGALPNCFISTNIYATRSHLS